MEEKKFNLIIVFVILPFIFLGDVFDIIAEFVSLTVIGLVVLFIAKAFSFFLWISLQLWFLIKGVRQYAYLAASIADLLGFPFGQTIGFLLTVILTNLLEGKSEKEQQTIKRGVKKIARRVANFARK